MPITEVMAIVRTLTTENAKIFRDEYNVEVLEVLVPSDKYVDKAFTPGRGWCLH